MRASTKRRICLRRGALREVTHLLGFSSQSYFIRQFNKKITDDADIFFTVKLRQDSCEPNRKDNSFHA